MSINLTQIARDHNLTPEQYTELVLREAAVIGSVLVSLNPEDQDGNPTNTIQATHNTPEHHVTITITCELLQ